MQDEAQIVATLKENTPAPELSDTKPLEPESPQPRVPIDKILITEAT